MQNQHANPSSQYPQHQQPYQQPYQQNYGSPPPGYAQHNPSAQPYQQPHGPGIYGYANPSLAGQYYQPPPPPLPSPQPSQNHVIPVATSGHNIFPHLCAPGTNTITLTILDRGEKKDFLLPPGAPKTKPLYTVKVTKDSTFRSTRMKVQYHDSQSKKPKSVCKLKMHTHYAELSFSWTKWDHWPFSEDKGWETEVDDHIRAGHLLDWRYLGGYKDDGWVIRCYDVDDAYFGVCSIIMDDFFSGRIEIDALSMTNQDCLDEMVTVAMATLDVYRSQQTAPDRAGTDPSSSSSSDSD